MKSWLTRNKDAIIAACAIITLALTILGGGATLFYNLLDAKFAAMGGQLTAMNNRIMAVEIKLTSMDVRLTSLETRFEDFSRRLTSIEEHLRHNGSSASNISLRACDPSSQQGSMNHACSSQICAALQVSHACAYLESAPDEHFRIASNDAPIFLGVTAQSAQKLTPRHRTMLTLGNTD